jgi:hypothetical protein
MKLSLLTIALCLLCLCHSTLAVLERVQDAVNDIRNKTEELNDAVARRSGYEIREQLQALLNSYKNNYDDVIEGLKDGGFSVEAGTTICQWLEATEQPFDAITEGLNFQRDILSSQRLNYRPDILRLSKQLSAQVTVFYNALGNKMTTKIDLKSRVLKIRNHIKKDIKSIVIRYCQTDEECKGYR